MKQVFFFLLVFFTGSGRVFADNNDAYIYIQGDGQTPFYVKLEGEMMPRLAKNYCVLTHLAAGAVHLQILFQQNKYPAQSYTVNLAASGHRAFLIRQMDQQEFVLTDLENRGHYLNNGNTLTDDNISADNQTLAVTDAVEVPPAEMPAPVVADVEEKSGPVKKAAKAGKKKAAAKEKMDPVVAEMPEPQETNDNGQESATTPPSRFMDKVVLDGNARRESKNNEVRVTKGERGTKMARDTSIAALPATDENGYFVELKKQSPAQPQEREAAQHAGSDGKEKDGLCSTAVRNDDFASLYADLKGRGDDESKLQYLKAAVVKYCYNTGQVMQFCDLFETQSARYEAASVLYTHTTDPDNYGQLDDLFSSRYLKNMLHKEVMGQN